MSVTAAQGFTAAGVAAGHQGQRQRPTWPWSSTTGPAAPPRASSPPTASRPRPSCGPSRWSRAAGRRGRPQLRRRQRLHRPARVPGHARHRRAGRRRARPQRRRGRRRLHRPDRRPAADGQAAARSRDGRRRTVRARRREGRDRHQDHRHRAQDGRRRTRDGWTVGGMAKGAGMLAPGLATMLVVLTTDADLDAGRRSTRRCAAPPAYHLRPGRLRRLHVHQRHRAAARLRRLRRHPAPRRVRRRRARGVRRPGPAADRRRRGRQQGHPRSRWWAPPPRTTRSRSARTIARNNLLKCAIHGEDPNWGRVLSAIGTTQRRLRTRPARRRHQRRVGVQERRGRRGPRPGRHALPRGPRRPPTWPPATASAMIWTNDLTADYVHENSAYSAHDAPAQHTALRQGADPHRGAALARPGTTARPSSSSSAATPWSTRSSRPPSPRTSSSCGTPGSSPVVVHGGGPQISAHARPARHGRASSRPGCG